MGEHPSAVVPRLQQGVQSAEPEIRNRCKKLLSLSPPQMLDGLIEWIYLERISGSDFSPVDMPLRGSSSRTWVHGRT